MTSRTRWVTLARRAPIVLILLMAALLGAAGAASAAPTVVSIQFDDGWADQYVARSLLNAHGMRGTFFVNAHFLGQPNRLTWAQVRQLAADGHEIGGHTLDHPHLPTLSADDQRREICDDRATLLAQGLAVRSFAYPHGEYDATTRAIAGACGYVTARTVQGVGSATCNTCVSAETIPPLDPLATRTPPGVRTTTTLADLQTIITRAESRGGGWVQIFFHQICEGCGIYSASSTLLSGLLDWLQPRAASGTVVRTVGDVIGGPVNPAVLGPARVGNLLRNPSLETDANADGVPDCWQRTGFGVNTFTWGRIGPGRTGAFGERLTISSLTSGDRKLIPTLDTGGACAPWAAPGRRFQIDEWYRSDAARLRFVMYRRSTAGVWSYWSKGPYLPAASAWTRASWTTPPLPADATAVSGGLTLDAVGTADFDDVSLVEVP